MSSESCKWYIKQARSYCYVEAFPGTRYCKQHAEFMRRWIGKRHRESYAEANNVSEFGSGYSKFE